MATASSSQANSAEKVAGAVRVVMPDQNGSFQLNTPRAAVQKVQVVDVDMVLHMADGTKVVLAGGAMEAMDDKSKVKFADTSADTGRLLDTVGTIPLAPNDHSRVLNSDPIAAGEHTATTDNIGPGQTNVAVDRNAAPVASDPVTQLAKIISDNSQSVTNGAQNLSIPTQPTAGDASTTSSQAALTASQTGNDSVVKPTDVQLPQERPGTTPSTHVTGPAAPSLAVNLVNLTTQTKVGDVLYGSGGTPTSATDGSNVVQFAPQVINAGDDVHTIYASGNNNNTFVKVFNVTVSGDVTVKTLTVSGVPAGVTILNGTNMGGGVYQITIAAGQKDFALQLQYDTQLANPSSPVHDDGNGQGVFQLTFTTTLGTSDGVLTLDQTRYVAIKDASSSGDLSYLDPATGNTVLILPAQGVPHEVHAGNGGVTIYGSNANDLLYGGAGNDTIYGGAGSSSFFQGGGGADTLVGSATGNNTASYAGSPTGVTIDLVAGTGTGGDAQGDRLTNIQNLIGSSGNDTFIANAAANKLDGGAGGSDTVSYAQSTSGVTVDLVNNKGSGGYAEGDTYVNIQNVIGSTSNDTFIANAAANSFTGNGGSDTVSYAASTSGVTVNLKTGVGSGGYAQGDTYNGIQNFIGSAYDDVFVGNAAVNSFDGGAGGNDTVSYAGSTAGVTVNLVTGRGSNGDAEGDTYTRIQNVIGGSGNDTFIVGLDSKNFDGGGGTLNTVDYSGSSSAIVANMLTNTVTRTFEPVNQLTNIQKIVGSSYSDTFIGGTGADIFDGGLAGSDTVDYSASAAPVTVDLFLGTGQGGNAQGDTLVHIQNVKGSSAGGNTFYASADANHFDGNSTSGNTVNYSHATGAVIVDLTNTRDNTLAQNFATGDTFTNIQNVVGSVYDDLIVASAQVNAIDGGLGNNTVSYEQSTGAVKIDLALGQGSLGDAAGDTYTNIQNAIGGAGNDIFVGNGVVNKFDGGAGSNTISYERSTTAVTVNLATGQGLAGDAAGDTYLNIQNATGGGGDDTIVASSVANVIDGGLGNNRVSYENSTAGVKVDLFLGQGFNNDATGDTYFNIQNATGGSGNDIFVGNGVVNKFDGGSGNNTVSYEHSTADVTINLATGQGTGGDANGDIYTNIQNATGGFGNDTIVANGVVNIIDGGGGNNTVSYANSGSGVKVNLATGQGLTGDAAGDTYANIQNVIGSAAGNNILVGSGVINVINGGGGSNNTVSYESSTGAVTIDLSQQKGLLGDAAGDTYVNIQNATGGAGDDLIIANNVANVIKGGAGINTVSYANSATGVTVNLFTGNGTGGDAQGDTYQDIQKVIGSNGDDTFVGNGQINEFWGGTGNNRVSYANSAAGVTIDLQLQAGTAGDAAGDTYHDIQNATGSAAGGNLIIASDVINKIDGGSSSNNTVSYSHATGAVKINLATGQGLLGDAAGDTYTNIQNATGGAGDDVIVANGVVNKIDGGAGNNTVSYESSTGAVKINLATGQGISGDAAGDTYVNIQNAIGGGGDDIIVASGVINKIDGGAGNNTVSYENSTAGVRVDLVNNIGTGGDADGDTYVNIQNATGGAGNDVFVGNGVANKFDGGGGSNTVSYEYSTGAVTIDLINQRGTQGDANNDTYANIQNAIGGAGDDTFIASSANNALDGRGGSNTVTYASLTTSVTVNLNSGIGGGSASGDTYANIQNVIGGSGNDILTGYGTVGVKSVLTGGAGADTLVGIAANSGNTWASYVGSAAVTIDLVAGTGSGGDAQGDTLSNIDNILGSSNNDTFIANGNANTFDGGGGLDTVSYAQSGSAVTVDLSGVSSPTGSGGFAQGDKYINIANVIGSSGNDTLTGSATASRSEVTGGAGADNLFAAAGNVANTYASYVNSASPVTIDFYNKVGHGGDAEGDSLNNITNAVGSNGADLFIASADVNRIEGGSGSDTVSYIYDTAGVTVDLFTGQGTGGLAQGDTYKSIENVIGGSGNDVFYGNNAANSFDGGAGNNTVNYSHSGSGVTVDLVANTGTGGMAQGDTYAHIQNVVGSTSSDLFYASSEVNIFTGGGGSDTVSYAKSTSANIKADLAANIGTGGDASGDVYNGISNLVGTGVANGQNWLVGNGGSNTLTTNGSTTVNRLEGGGSATDTGQVDIFNAQLGGSNTMIGGTGTNTFNVSAQNSSTIANMALAEGHGTNTTLHVESLGATLDLSTFSHRASGINNLDVSASTNANLLVSYDDIQHMGVNNVLTITMKSTESIQINTSTPQYYLIFGNGDYVFYSDASHATEIARIHVALAA